jgi:hypothetical protein
MRKLGLIISALAIIAAGSAGAAEPDRKGRDCKTPDAPYRDSDCLDTYLGDGFLERLINYYQLEWGHEAAPTDPTAPPVRRDHWPATPLSTPPFPFTECVTRKLCLCYEWKF